MGRRHSVNDLAREIGKVLPGWPAEDVAAMAVAGSVFGDVTIENHDVAIIIKDGRFSTAYKRRKSADKKNPKPTRSKTTQRDREEHGDGRS